MQRERKRERERERERKQNTDRNRNDRFGYNDCDHFLADFAEFLAVDMITFFWNFLIVFFLAWVKYCSLFEKLIKNEYFAKQFFVGEFGLFISRLENLSKIF